MEPSNKELQLCKNCQLYAYLLEAQGKEVPEEIEDCVNFYEYVVDCVSELYAELKSLDGDTFEKIVNNKDSIQSRELSYWWEINQEADRLHRALSADMEES